MGAKSLVRVGVVLTLLLAVPTGGAQAAGSAASDRPASEYVVVYSPAAKAEVLAAVKRAGGVVTGTVDALGLARVSAPTTSFKSTIGRIAAVRGVVRNNSVGTTKPGMPHRFVTERPTAAMVEAAGASRAAPSRESNGKAEPLASLQWDMSMIGATPNGAWKEATGRGVQVGIMDTGVDASHPDIAPNFNARLSRNFTMDIPSIDGPCDTPTCIDPANVDQGGHGTHVAGTIAAARNGIGIAGVAPNAQIVNIRAGQDSGFFFLYETAAALVYSGDIHLDVVNMSFFTDPWLYNCDTPDDYISGAVTQAQLEEQALTRQVLLAATAYAADRGVSLFGAAGNEHVNMTLPTRIDSISPDYPLGTASTRVVTKDCLDLPTEAPNVIAVSAVGPSTTKADYSNYGLGDVDIAAPGGWFRDLIGTPGFQTPGNLVLSTYPLALAIEEGLANPDGTPADAFSTADCSVSPCAFYTRLQGTSMASPHAAGVAALIIEAHGKGNKSKGFSLAPSSVKSILLATASDHACPVGGTEIYTDEGRPAEFNAVCDGTTANNGLYGEGIVNATAAVR
jgi:lantibiotic leader peptide-processing serine protease